MDAKFVQERITKLRLMQDISEYQLSKELGHTRGYIQAISSGKMLPSLTALFEICDYFHISLKDFFDETEVDSETSRDLIKETQNLTSDAQYYLLQFLKENRKTGK